MKRPATYLILLASVSLTSCKLLPGGKPEAAPAGVQVQGTIPSLRGWALMYPELANGGNPTASASVAGDGTPSEAEGGMFDFSGVVQTGATAPSRVPWNRSATDAIKQSRMTGRPLLTLFTHQMSQPAQAMENTFLLTPEFREMAGKDFVLLRLDFSDEDTARSDYYRDLKKRFKANGYPTLIVTTPDGKELSHVSGYKPEWQTRHPDSLKAAIISSKKASDARRKSLESAGYRTWKDKAGTPVFAKLNSVDANMGSFTGEWGEPFKTFLNRLSQQDQDWIASRRKDA